MRRIPVVIVMALAATLSPQAFAQSTTFDIEAGYQSVDVDGNEDMYRSQVNQDDGFILRSFVFSTLNPDGNGWYDRIHVDASGFGGEPSGRFRLDAGKGKAYRFRLTYHEANFFSALPELANPFIDDGVIPGQHTMDRNRKMLNLELELLPGRALTPIVGYRWNQHKGPGQTTYHVGQDEFRLSSDIEETEEEYYVGLTFAAGDFAGSLIQGWRDFDGRENLSLMPGAESGNNPGPVLGRDVYADTLDRESRTEADTPVTTFHLTGLLTEGLHMTASYVRANAESETRSAEVVSGNLASYRISRFFDGLDQSISSQTEHPSWRGDLHLGIDFSSSVNLTFGYEARHRSLEGWSLISSLYTDTMTFGGLDTGDLTELLEINNTTDRKDDTVDVRLSLSDLGAFTIWAGGSHAKEKLNVAQDVAQIIVPGAQYGDFERAVTTAFLGTAVQIGGSRVSFDVHNESADAAIVRTDFTDRLRLRLRLLLPLHRTLELLATAEVITANNSSTGIGYSADTDHLSLDLAFTPNEHFTLRGIWDTYSTSSSIPVRIPQDFSISRSEYLEDGTMLEAQMQIHAGRFDLDVGYSSFENDGTFELSLDRAYARASFELCAHASVILEYEDWQYQETMFSAADFDARRYAALIRFRR